MHKCEARSEDSPTGPNCSNGIIVYYARHYSFFTISVVPSTISRRLAEAFKMSAFNPYNISGIIWSGVEANHHGFHRSGIL
ncbi:hypothetical protein TNCV_2976061 [Trichonephila clavipes]|nr:hypothetical protein TNCV_2976061 [Trichonephila clavipes]